MSKIKLAIIGMGKIARDQHIPALAANPAFELVAIASPREQSQTVPTYPNIEALLRAVPTVDAVAICTPPHVRYHIARYALNCGRHVLLEKPPGATLSEAAALIDLAAQRNVTLFATWHSREAPAVEPARNWLANRFIRRVVVTWKEDVREWHPGQTWIWQAGGFGVFDPGINALSIITRILPQPLVLNDAELFFPANCDTPIAANLSISDANGAEVRVELDFRQTGRQSWDIDVDTDTGRLLLSNGGATLQVGQDTLAVAPEREYPNLYARFESLIGERRIDADLAPLRLVADAFLRGRRITVEPFVE